MVIFRLNSDANINYKLSIVAVLYVRKVKSTESLLDASEGIAKAGVQVCTLCL
jgi:hypothetical protein